MTVVDVVMLVHSSSVGKERSMSTVVEVRSEWIHHPVSDPRGLYPNVGILESSVTVPRISNAALERY
jgi:hypothetical protein